MCGIVGIVGRNNRDVNHDLYDAMTVLQHRGQDAAGMMTCESGRFNQRKSNGLVRDVFRVQHMQSLKGNYGLGHVRYPTAGSSSPALAQPLYVNSPYGISLAHNGNLTNSESLGRHLFEVEQRHLNTDSDSEILLNVFANELQKVGGVAPNPDNVFAAVSAVHRRCEGAYAAVGMIASNGVFGFRDSNGIRPLVFGKKETPHGIEFMIASESVALDVLQFKLVRDVAPGEAIYITKEGEFFSRQCAADPKSRPCIFEHVYFARPDSIMDRISVYKSRLRMGEKLAAKIIANPPPEKIDVVIPVPESSRVAGQVLAYDLGVKFREGLIKNRYIGRTFIMPGQKQRRKSVRQKLNPIRLEFEGKNVLLVDDSIVRGTTCQQIIQMARDAGANKVYFASAAPEVKYPNVYGIDMPSPEELVANGKTVDEIRKTIGADWLVFQELHDLKDCLTEGNPEITEFDCSVFDGNYIAGNVDEEYLKKLARQRNDNAKEEMEKRLVETEENYLIGLHNQ